MIPDKQVNCNLVNGMRYCMCAVAGLNPLFGGPHRATTENSHD